MRPTGLLPIETVKFDDPYKGKTLDVKGMRFRNVFVPLTLASEFASGWSKDVFSLCSYFPDAHFMISSVISSLDGTPRSPSSSHAAGNSCDIAPLFTKDVALHPDLNSPRMADQRGLAAFLASIADSFPGFGITLEGDHFHLDRRLDPGCYLYSTYRDIYKGDKLNSWLKGSPISQKLFIAHADGTITLY